jgi:hypothetical protein
MKTSTSKRNNESTGHYPALPAKRVSLGHFFFKSREDQRAFASKSGKEKRDQGTDAPKGKRWVVVA